MSGAEIGGGAIPAPPGVTPNLINPVDHTKQNIILHTICLVLITTAITVRLYTRAFITRKLGADDYLGLFSWAMTVSFSALLLAADYHGIGRHLWDVPRTWLVPGLKLLFVSEILYIPIALAIKLTFLFFFDRIFAVDKSIKWCIRGAMAANFIFYLAIFFRSVFLCIPVERSYNPQIKGKCGSELVLPYLTGIWGFLSDFYLLFLPMYCVWKLKMRMHHKVKLMATFGVGLFACVASIIRFAYTVKLVNNIDATWNFSQLSLYSVLEINIGLVCACLPTFPALFDRYLPGVYSYMFRLKSHFSLKRSSESGSHRTYGASWGLLGRGTDAGSKGLPVNGNGGGSHSEISDKMYLANKQRGSLRGDGGNFYMETTVRGKTSSNEDIEAWPPSGGVGVVRTVDLQENYPMGPYKGRGEGQ